MPMAFAALHLYPLNADSLFKRNHTVNIARLTNAHTILGKSSRYVDFEGWVKSGYAIMQRSVASLFFVGNYVPHYSVLDAYSNFNGTFINVSPESESYTGQYQITSYVSTLPYFCFF
jgi:hypothetical protein